MKLDYGYYYYYYNVLLDLSLTIHLDLRDFLDFIIFILKYKRLIYVVPKTDI